MKPPYVLNPKVLSLFASVSEKIGAVREIHGEIPRTDLRKSNRIRTIHSSLAIEGNTLTESQVTGLLENKRVAGPPKDIREVGNAILAYEAFETFQYDDIKSFLKAHRLLMGGLIPDAGMFRTKGSGIVKGNILTHVPPPAKHVAGLMKNLFSYIKKDPDPILIKSCVFHYELEFIHPFSDGNGRMGRLWQSVILKNQHPVFAWLPVEAIIRERQKEYYTALNLSDKSGNSTPFLEFMLSSIAVALAQLLDERSTPPRAEERLAIYRTNANQNFFTRKNYLSHFKTISTATASRDLNMAVNKKILKRTGDKNTAKYKFGKS